MKNKQVTPVFIFLIILLFSFSFVSAGGFAFDFSKWFGKVTGNAISSDCSYQVSTCDPCAGKISNGCFGGAVQNSNVRTLCSDEKVYSWDISYKLGKNSKGQSCRYSCVATNKKLVQDCSLSAIQPNPPINTQNNSNTSRPLCTEQDWTFNLSTCAFVEGTIGRQTKTWIKLSPTCSGGIQKTASEVVECNALVSNLSNATNCFCGTFSECNSALSNFSCAKVTLTNDLALTERDNFVERFYNGGGYYSAALRFNGSRLFDCAGFSISRISGNVSLGMVVYGDPFNVKQISNCQFYNWSGALALVIEKNNYSSPIYLVNNTFNKNTAGVLIGKTKFRSAQNFENFLFFNNSFLSNNYGIKLLDDYNTGKLGLFNNYFCSNDVDYLGSNVAFDSKFLLTYPSKNVNNRFCASPNSTQVTCSAVLTSVTGLSSKGCYVSDCALAYKESTSYAGSGFPPVSDVTFKLVSCEKTKQAGRIRTYYSFYPTCEAIRTVVSRCAVGASCFNRQNKDYGYLYQYTANVHNSNYQLVKTASC